MSYGTIETLRYAIEVWSADGQNLVEVLGRVSKLRMAEAAFKDAIEEDPDRYLTVRERARVIRKHLPVE